MNDAIGDGYTDTTEVHPAGHWTCDNCGTDNFVRFVRPSPGAIPPDMVEAMRESGEYSGTDPDGEFLMCPETVKCSFCETTYKTDDGSEDA